MGNIEYQLMAVSPLDGRYANRIEDLPDHVSEFGLIHARVTVMAGWLATLGSGVLPDRQPLSDRALRRLDYEIPADFSLDDAVRIKEIESKTNHDVKAAEVWLTEQLSDASFNEYRTLVHFGCTSEDVNSSAYAIMLRDARDHVLLPPLFKIGTDLLTKSEMWADLPMLSLTHGQPATPTTLGKEMRVYYERLDDQTSALDAIRPRAKFSGATGGYNAASFAYPEVDWPAVSKQFVEERLGVDYAPVTTQIEPHDWMARYLNEVGVVNAILKDMAGDIWYYISRGILKQKMKEGEVGSSTMPHKVNPIDFENAEGNFDIAGGILQRLASSLPNSRLQRDLSDSTRLRAIGPALGHSLVGYASIQKGMGKIVPNEEALAEELDENWAVLTEAVQTVMRRYNVPDAYNRIKAASRGREMDKFAYLELVASLTEIPEEAFRQLMILTPSTYLGYQPEIARSGGWIGEKS